MRTTLRLLIVSVALPLCGFARLGETEQQLEKRFGAPNSRTKEITLGQGKVIEFGTKLRFRQGDWSIECAVIDGRCAKVTYQKPGDWTRDQFTTVLTSNGQGLKWADLSKEMVRALSREWRRDDGATAVWKMGMGMWVTHPAYERAKEQAVARAKAEAARIPKI
jgi:hypothetical protein